jgi:hypothetical protein
MATGRIGVTPVLRTRWSKLPTTGTTVLSGLDDNSVALVYDAGYEAVYRNGVLLSRGNDYTATDGTTVTLIDATLATDIIEIFANDLVPLTDAISKGQYNAKGALLSATAASTPAVLAVGTNDQVLTADSTTSTGLKWAAPAAGGMTSLATGTLSGTSVVLSSINQTYQSLYLVINGASVAATATPLIVRQNAITTNYAVTQTLTSGTTINNSTTLTGYRIVDTYNVPTGTDSQSIFTYEFPQYYKATQHPVSLFATNLSEAFSCICFADNNAAITSLTITTVAGSTFDAGTYTLYGVK